MKIEEARRVLTIDAGTTGHLIGFPAYHFHDILLTDVVDVMPHPGTSRETLDHVQAFAERLGQTVIVLERENSSYVFNAMLSELMVPRDL